MLERRAHVSVAGLRLRIGPPPADSGLNHERVPTMVLDALDLDLHRDHTVNQVLLDDTRVAVGRECDVALGEDRERNTRIGEQSPEGLAASGERDQNTVRRGANCRRNGDRVGLRPAR